MGKQNRGRFKCISVPPKTAAAAPAAAPLNEVDPATGLLKAAWLGSEWRNTQMGYGAGAQQSYEEIKERFPGISDDEAQRQLFPSTGDAAGDSMMELELESAAAAVAGGAAKSAPKTPITSLSRRTPAKSRSASRMGTPAPSAPGSPALGATPSSAAAMSDASVMAATPSRVSVTGATWKSPATNPLSTPRRALANTQVIGRSKTLSRSWNEKRRLRDQAAEAKELQKRLSEAAAEERREAARRAAQKAAYRKEQELKNQKVQVITDTRKIKRMSRKQLRQVQKMDTGTVGREIKAVTSRALSRGIGHKIATQN